MKTLSSLLLSTMVAATVIAACCSSNFTPKNEITGVRILAARADQPYAKPGESVHLQVLAHDGRAAKPEPMRLFWFPVPCVNPPAGQPYGCYPAFHALFPTGVDLTPTLVDMGASFAIATGGVLTLTIAASPNASSVWVRVVDEVSGAVFEQEVTADLPVANQFLAPRLYMNNGGTAAAVAFDCSGVYLESDY